MDGANRTWNRSIEVILESESWRGEAKGATDREECSEMMTRKQVKQVEKHMAEPAEVDEDAVSRSYRS